MHMYTVWHHQSAPCMVVDLPTGTRHTHSSLECMQATAARRSSMTHTHFRLRMHLRIRTRTSSWPPPCHDHGLRPNPDNAPSVGPTHYKLVNAEPGPA